MSWYSIYVPVTGNTSVNYIQHDTCATNTVAGNAQNGTVIVYTGPPEPVCELPTKKHFVPQRHERPWTRKEKTLFCPRIVQRPEFHARSNPRSG